MSEQNEPGSATSPGRRTVLRGAAVAGGLLWATPVVQVLTAPAYAAGSPPVGVGTGLSYVAVLLRAAGLDYIVKFEMDDMKVESGKVALPFCEPWPVSVPATLGDEWAQLVQTYSYAEGRFALVLTSGVELVDWAAKQGNCCFTQSQPSSATGYRLTRDALTRTVVFPAAPEQPPCSLLEQTKSEPTTTPTPTADSNGTATTVEPTTTADVTTPSPTASPTATAASSTSPTPSTTPTPEATQSGGGKTNRQGGRGDDGKEKSKTG